VVSAPCRSDAWASSASASRTPSFAPCLSLSARTHTASFMPGTDDRTVIAGASIRSADSNASKTLASSEVVTSSEPAGALQTVNAAIARTSARTLALYFARPVRLFRPSKRTRESFCEIGAHTLVQLVAGKCFGCTLGQTVTVHCHHHMSSACCVHKASTSYLTISFHLFSSTLPLALSSGRHFR